MHAPWKVLAHRVYGLRREGERSKEAGGGAGLHHPCPCRVQVTILVGRLSAVSAWHKVVPQW